ncbi:BCCT family transporter [Sphingopyxis indica]|uniref:BCCT family transporter n=1 Tax=Sphingopyxis indica TaxID=436663 RepID=UPI002938E3D8|nr:BCCT family transporter [Sphingopyxis indica]WOF44140.1 BCCT family transporter [Sphingopyxis indica]
MGESDRQATSASSHRIKINPPVFYTSAALTLAFVVLGSLFVERAGTVFAALQRGITTDFGWFYIVSVAGFLIFLLFLMFSSYGNVKLGADDSEPEYSYLSWFAMLFSAGMGIGLLFFGVAEPIQHFATPPVGEGHTIEAARQAMILTFFHWGFHAWAIYIVVGLALAYFAFRRGLPLTVRSALFPLIGRRIYGPIGHAIDIFAVLGTMFGVATSLGFGVLQVNAGFHHLFGLPVGPWVQLALIAAITALATLSAFVGLDRGIKRLSELNILVAVALLIFVLLAGSTIFLIQAYVQNLGAYLGALVQRTFRMYAYEPNDWFSNWTLFYWGWWISWSPFVGMFIARISRGRTIREFVTGVLLVPSLFTFLWMTVFGNTAIAMDLNGTADLAAAVAKDMPVALFRMFEHLPFSVIASGLATLLVITFFVTSADSAALVIDTITSGDADDPPAWQRIFWAVGAGVVAAVLLVAGGLQALQTAAIASALPFTVVMIFMCYGLLRALQAESGGADIDLSATAAAPFPETGGWTWQQRLTSITRFYARAEIDAFLSRDVRSALDDVAREMRQNGLAPDLVAGSEAIELSVPHGKLGTFQYAVRKRAFRAPSFAFAETPKAQAREPLHYRAMATGSEGDQPHDVTGYSQAQLINDILNRYARFRHSRRIG